MARETLTPLPPLSAKDLQAGSPEAWESLYQRPYPLFRMVTRKVGVPFEEIEDVIQDGFLKVAQGVDRLLPDANPIPWITTVVKNTAIDHQRAAGRRLHPDSLTAYNAQGIEIEAGALTTLIDPVGNPEDMVVAQEAAQELLSGMSQREKTIFIRKAEGGNDKEIAEEVMMHPGSVRTIAYRVRHRLR